MEQIVVIHQAGRKAFNRMLGELCHARMTSPHSVTHTQ